MGGAPAARGCWITDRRRLLWGEPQLRGAAGLEKCRVCFGGSSRCAGLLDRSQEEAAFGRSPAARGCSIGERKKLLFGELPLRGAAGLQNTAKRRLLLGELPLRGAARLEKCRGCFWGSSRCAGLLDWRKEEAALGGDPAARGCSIGVRKRLPYLGELSLRGAAGLQTGGSCFAGSSRCAGLLDWSREWLLWGEPQLRGAAGPDICVYVTMQLVEKIVINLQ